jgi:hypothetical protein
MLCFYEIVIDINTLIITSGRNSTIINLNFRFEKYEDSIVKDYNSIITDFAKTTQLISLFFKQI